MAKKKPFGKLPDDVQAKLQVAERLIPGYWTTSELAKAFGVGRMAIVMQVQRGVIEPLARQRGKQMMFSDEQVVKWLLNRKKPGRPVGWRKAKDA